MLKPTTLMTFPTSIVAVLLLISAVKVPEPFTKIECSQVPIIFDRFDYYYWVYLKCSGEADALNSFIYDILFRDS